MKAQETAQKAAAYFRSQPGLARLLAGCVEKYRRHGRLAGKVMLPKASEEERQALEAFLRRRLEAEENLLISLREVALALQDTCFAEADLVAVLQAYAGEELLPRSQVRLMAQEQRDLFFQQLLRENSQPSTQRWLQAVWEKDAGVQRAQRAYTNGCEEEKQLFWLAAKALAQLSEAKERLPVYAARIFGDPHALDSTTTLGRVFLEALRFLRPEAGQDDFSRTEEEAELLYHFGLLRDDVLNFVTCAGLAAFRQQGGCEIEVSYWREAWRQRAVLNAPLRELAGLSSLRPAGKAKEVVYIVENSGVFSALLDVFEQSSLPLPPLMCTHGNFKLASWVAVNLLTAGGCTLCYSGDLDPEGLLAADALYKRNPQQVRLWHYGLEDYHFALPKDAPLLPEARLKKMEGLSCPELRALAQVLQQKKRAAYQEALLSNLLADLLLLVQGDGSPEPKSQENDSEEPSP